MLFINNKYTRIYYSIIENAKSRNLPTNFYKETHHIIPKSLGGSNNKNNLIKLTAREHFICHWLLTKMTEGKSQHLMIFALHSMAMKNKFTERRYLNARVYERNKKIVSQIRSIKSKENNPMFNKEVKEKHKESIKKRGPTLGTTGLTHSTETKERMSNAAKGRKLSNSTRQKLRDVNLNLWKEKREKGLDKRKPLSEETKRKISETLKKKNV